MDNELDLLARKYDTDKRTNDAGQNIYHGYTPIYEQYLKHKRLSKNNILEIGVREGSSHKMWEEYFPNSTIYGIDDFSDIACTVKKEDMESDRIKIIVGNQSDKELIDSNFKDISLDVVIDDGSHRSWHQQESFKYLWKYLESGGLYFIEDLAVCYMREFREFDDIRSSTLQWLQTIKDKKIPYCYYIDTDDMRKICSEIESVDIIGELAIIKKK